MAGLHFNSKKSFKRLATLCPSHKLD